MQPLLAVENLSVSFRTYAGAIQAVRDVSFTLDKGEIIGIVGPNGAGKTTLMSVIGGQIHPSRGAVFFQGRDITNWPPHRR